MHQLISWSLGEAARETFFFELGLVTGKNKSMLLSGCDICLELGGGNMGGGSWKRTELCNYKVLTDKMK